MAAEINILSSEILEHPEMCYDFEKSNITTQFECLMQSIWHYKIYSSLLRDKVTFVKARGSSGVEYCIDVPEWMLWLIYNSKWRRVVKLENIDKWHYARVFMHKCIDESAKRSIDRIRSKRIVDFYRTSRMVLEDIVTINGVEQRYDRTKELLNVPGTRKDR